MLRQRGGARFAVRFYFFPLLEDGKELQECDEAAVGLNKAHHLHGFNGVHAPTTLLQIAVGVEWSSQGDQPCCHVSSAVEHNNRVRYDHHAPRIGVGDAGDIDGQYVAQTQLEHAVVVFLAHYARYVVDPSTVTGMQLPHHVDAHAVVAGLCSNSEKVFDSVS